MSRKTWMEKALTMSRADINRAPLVEDLNRAMIAATMYRENLFLFFFREFLNLRLFVDRRYACWSHFSHGFSWSGPGFILR